MGKCNNVLQASDTLLTISGWNDIICIMYLAVDSTDIDHPG